MAQFVTKSFLPRNLSVILIFFGICIKTVNGGSVNVLIFALWASLRQTFLPFISRSLKAEAFVWCYAGWS